MSPGATAPFGKILVANRGEIAVRIMRTIREMGMSSVAVHSDVEADALHVRVADEAVQIGGPAVGDSYLRIDRIVEAALASGAEAIHPGYGLLAENPEFVEACERAGLVFIGPPAAAMRSMGSKVAARDLMSTAGVPVVPGMNEPIVDLEQARKWADEIGYPVAAKASGAGGGKGFRVATNADELEKAIGAASGEGERYFGDGTVYLERYLDDPRHVEVQVLADQHGTTLHLLERDCSVQRRHQKLVEECPAPQLSDEQRDLIGSIAVHAAEAVGYTSAGTVEGLFAGGEFYFLEMNTRIQVEHSVTELVTGLDLVAEQIRIAAGLPLEVTQEQVVPHGHAIECRINAEDARRRFLPSPGMIDAYREPRGEHVRVDASMDGPGMVLPYYDTLLSKLIVWGEDREAATARMLDALADYEIDGVSTLIPFHRALLASQEWHDAQTCRNLIEDKEWLAAIE